MALVKPRAAAEAEHAQRRRPRDFEGLVAQLGDDDEVARRWAARDLTAFPGAATSRALVARLDQERDASVLECVLTALTRLGDDVAVAGLVECLRSESPPLRNGAIEAMKQLPEEVAPIMGRLLEDEDSDVRIFAVNILESLRHPQVEAWLVAVIERDPHVNVCGAAVDLLGEVGSLTSRPALERLKARFAAQPYICFATELALKRLHEQ